MGTRTIDLPAKHVVTKGDIAHAVEAGATSFKEEKKAAKVSKACGRCKKKAKKFTKKLLKQSKE